VSNPASSALPANETKNKTKLLNIKAYIMVKIVRRTDKAKGEQGHRALDGLEADAFGDEWDAACLGPHYRQIDHREHGGSHGKHGGRDGDNPVGMVVRARRDVDEEIAVCVRFSVSVIQMCIFFVCESYTNKMSTLLASEGR